MTGFGSSGSRTGGVDVGGQMPFLVWLNYPEFEDRRCRYGARIELSPTWTAPMTRSDPIRRHARDISLALALRHRPRRLQRDRLGRQRRRLPGQRRGSSRPLRGPACRTPGSVAPELAPELGTDPALDREVTSFFFSYDEAGSTASRDLSLFAIAEGAPVPIPPSGARSSSSTPSASTASAPSPPAPSASR